MKIFKITFLLFGAFMFASMQLVFADNGKYISAMQKNIDAVYKAKSIEEYQQAVNSFERIGAAEKTKWEPYYYSAFGNIMMANREQDGAKKDLYLDQAKAAIDKAKAIIPDESEVIALEGFVHMIRVTVDPGSRGPQYAGLAMQTFGKATALNPENPRALSLMAQMQYGTAKFFKSETTEACNTLRLALEKFDNFKSDNPLAPRWGRGMAEELKTQCK
jgi:tetratricopeptide (TPR) repeat protein